MTKFMVPYLYIYSQDVNQFRIFSNLNINLCRQPHNTCSKDIIFSQTEYILIMYLQKSLCLIEFPSLHDCVLSDHEQVGYDVIIYELRVLQMYVLLYAFFDTANAYGTHWPQQKAMLLSCPGTVFVLYDIYKRDMITPIGRSSASLGIMHNCNLNQDLTAHTELKIQ